MFEFDPSKKYQKTTSSRAVIRFQDCDPLRHLNNAKYFDYFFNSREDQVPKLYSIQMSEIFRTYDAIWVVYNHQIAYLNPAQMGEWVKIFSRIIWHNENTVIVEYFMTDDEEKVMKTMLWTTLRYVNNDGHSMNHPEKLNEFLTAVSCGLDKEALVFGQRLKLVKKAITEGSVDLFS